MEPRTAGAKWAKIKPKSSETGKNRAESTITWMLSSMVATRDPRSSSATVAYCLRAGTRGKCVRIPWESGMRSEERAPISIRHTPTEHSKKKQPNKQKATLNTNKWRDIDEIEKITKSKSNSKIMIQAKKPKSSLC